MTRPSIGVVGAGRVGAVLAARLRHAGYPVVEVSARSEASRLRVATLLPDVEIAPPAEVAERCDVLLLAVPDDLLVAVAEELAPYVHPGQYVLHTSGRHGLAALESMTLRGARAVAFHPAMTFTGTEVDLDRRCVFGLTAADVDHPFVEELVAALGGTPMWVAEEDRITYHAALAHGANHVSTLLNQAMDLLRQAGAADPAAVLRPLVNAAVDNTLTYGDAALTGPVVRGDVTTVRAHLAALSEEQEIRETYLAVARATAERVERPEILDELFDAELRA